MEIKLNAQKRSSEEKVAKLRSDRVVPGIVYGRDAEPTMIKVNLSELVKTERVAGKNNVITLDIEGETKSVLIQDFQLEPVSGDFMAIDFLVVTDDSVVTAKIPVKFFGASAAAKLGAMIDEKLKTIKVKCKVVDLVDGFNVDLALLKEAGDNIKVKDVQLEADKYTLVNHPNEVIVSAVKLRGSK